MLGTLTTKKLEKDGLENIDYFNSWKLKTKSEQFIFYFYQIIIWGFGVLSISDFYKI